MGPHGNRMNTTGETTVSAQDDSDEQQEVIEVQILPQVNIILKVIIHKEHNSDTDNDTKIKWSMIRFSKQESYDYTTVRDSPDNDQGPRSLRI